MRELLERWSQLERQRCAETKHQPGYFGIAGSFEIGRRVRVPKGSAVSLSDAGLILAATIEAIEARGWDFMLWSDGKGTREGCVRVPSSDPKRFDTPYGPGLVNVPPAEALLAAYLAAIETEAA